MSKIETSIIVQSSISAMVKWFEYNWLKHIDPAEYETRKLDVVLTPSLTDLRQLKIIKDSSLTYPFCGISVARIAIDTEKAGYARRHMISGISRNLQDNSAYVRNLTPVKVGLAARFVSDNQADMYSLATMLINNSPGPSLVIRDNQGFHYENRVFFDPEIEIPSQTSETDGKYFNSEFVFSINSYVGTMSKQPLITNIKVDFLEGHGSVTQSIYLDIENGQVNSLKEYNIRYSDLFDRDSVHFRG
jgi:hypothetical protein